MKKIMGAFLIILALLLLYLVFTFMLACGLFATWLASLPTFLILLIGSAPFLNVAPKKAVEGWLTFAIITSIPWITVLPNVYQILSIIFLAVATASSLYWYRRKYKTLRSHAER